MNSINNIKDNQKPEWAPLNSGDEFASYVVKGISLVEKTTNYKTKLAKDTKKYSIENLLKGILQQDRITLAKAITLIESNSQKHIEDAQELIKIGRASCRERV